MAEPESESKESEPGIYSIKATLWCCVLKTCCCSITKLCLTLFDPMDYNVPDFPVLHHLLEFTQTHWVHWVNAIQPSHPLLSPSSWPRSLPASGSFTMNQLFAWGGQSIGVCWTLLVFKQALLLQEGWGWIWSIGFYHPGQFVHIHQPRY